MLLLLLLLLLLGSGPRLSEAIRRSHVHKRGLLELAGTLDCVGPRSPMAYMNYGCYCGLGGHGEPRDAIDWCCHHHDCCYSRAQEAGCSPKIDHYSWKCIDHRIQCDASGYFLRLIHNKNLPPSGATISAISLLNPPAYIFQ
ncbi:hypothetical protein STEG23_032691 [Scotinomys teguina]